MKKVTIWKLFYYMIIYSFFGFVLETLYALITAGVLESRQSFIYGPFCIIYGIGAIIIISVLYKYKYQNIKLFIFGMIIGSLIEYLASLIGEIFLHAIWWNYSNEFLNISGRTCLYYAILWGILSILLINYINPKISSLYYLITRNLNIIKTKIILSILMILFIIDSIFTYFVLENFLIRVSKEQNFKINGIVNNSENIFLSENFPNEKMILIYPNIIVLNENKEVVYLNSLLNKNN